MKQKGKKILPLLFFVLLPHTAPLQLQDTRGETLKKVAERAPVLLCCCSSSFFSSSSFSVILPTFSFCCCCSSCSTTCVTLSLSLLCLCCCCSTAPAVHVCLYVCLSLSQTAAAALLRLLHPTISSSSLRAQFSPTSSATSCAAAAASAAVDMMIPPHNACCCCAAFLRASLAADMRLRSTNACASHNTTLFFLRLCPHTIFFFLPLQYYSTTILPQKNDSRRNTGRCIYMCVCVCLSPPPVLLAVDSSTFPHAY